MAHKVIAYALPVAVGWIAAFGLLAMSRNSQASMKAAAAHADGLTPIAKTIGEAPALGDNADLWSMVAGSETDHNQLVPKLSLTPTEIADKDLQRAERVRKMYQAGLIVTAKDCYNAAIIMQRGRTPEDFILAHDLAVLALSMGLKRATWLTAETEDKYLISVGKPQRFATQYKPNEHGFLKIFNIDPTVTDAHRQSMGANTLSEAQRQNAPPLAD